MKATSATAERILDEAELRMRHGGYNAVSFRDLAKAVGIRSASIHYHFPQKEDLAVALVHRYSAKFFTALAEQTRDASDSIQRVRQFCCAYRRDLLGANAICLCGMLGAESCGIPQAVSAAVAGFLQANIDWLVTALPTGLNLDERRSRAIGIVASLQGAMILAVALNDVSLFDDTMNRILRAQDAT
ncbi:TetR/AcrR family transcriptional regulator [Sorangium cellulosum]|uniref:HTH tetR-type domain-containing protein n=2 Tax=Sorangium cellulosum TaxID=56 RepID=A0A150TQJ5_SORCE|nr:TetR/AcrR family transcriptional regulator [Sorangium cellulosum]AGP34642.1 hypothetical protein SCE1572_09050 [Sorangium cellulosum So0157-2]KYG06748.1 hypothetical protein BE21_33035 [Sorangium cellulosum]